MTSKTPKFFAAAAVALLAVSAASSSYAEPCDTKSDWQQLVGKQAKIVVEAMARSDGWIIPSSDTQPVPINVTGEYKAMVRVNKVGGSESLGFVFAKGPSDIHYTIQVERRKVTKNVEYSEVDTVYEVSADVLRSTTDDPQSKGYQQATECSREYLSDKNAFLFRFMLP